MIAANQKPERKRGCASQTRAWSLSQDLAALLAAAAPSLTVGFLTGELQEIAQSSNTLPYGRVTEIGS